MSIEVKCPCGRTIYASDDQAGSHLQCPHCKASVAIPSGVAQERPPTPSNPADEAIFELVGCVVAGIVIWIYSADMNPKLVKTLLFGCVLGIGHALSKLMK